MLLFFLKINFYQSFLSCLLDFEPWLQRPLRGTSGPVGTPQLLACVLGRHLCKRCELLEVVPMENQNVDGWTQIKRETKNRFWPSVNTKSDIKQTISENYILKIIVLIFLEKYLFGRILIYRNSSIWTRNAYIWYEFW